MDFRVLGPVAVSVEGKIEPPGGRLASVALAVLLAHHEETVSRDRLIEAMWGNEPPRDARNSLYGHVFRLRQLVGQRIEGLSDGYRLRIEPQEIDAVMFETMFGEGRNLLVTDPRTAADHLADALALWRGRPYSGLWDVVDLNLEAHRLEELRLQAVELRIDAQLAAGDHELIVAEIEALAEEHPTRERFRAQQMLALYRSGRQADALAAFRKAEAYLAEYLGLEPSAELRDLELAILEQDEKLRAGPGRVVTQRLAVLATDLEGSDRERPGPIPVPH